MNDIITIKKLAEEIASMTGTDIATAESFLNEFFATIEDGLAGGETIKIKGIGSFSRSDAADEPVVFTPEKDFIDAVNTPFEMFSAVDIDDSISDEDLAADDAEETTASDEEETAEDVVETDQTDEADEVVELNEAAELEEADEITQASDEADNSESSDNTDESDPSDPSDLSDPVDAPDNSDSSDSSDSYNSYDSYNSPDEPDSPGKKPFIYGLIIGLVAGFACGWIVSSYLSNKDSRDAEVIATADEAIANDKALADSIAEQTEDADSITTDTLVAVSETVVTNEVKPVEKPKAVVTDTIRSNCFLTTMARRYYGKMEYWAFIYEANADKLGHPNRIKPGTVVVIPPVDEIRRGQSDAETLQRAKALGKEIYARYE